MKRRRHTPEQVTRKLREAERLLGERKTIPEAAKTQPKMIEGGTPGSDPPNDRDRHLLLVDVDNRIDYELYQVWWNGSRWTAGSGGT